MVVNHGYCIKVSVRVQQGRTGFYVISEEDSICPHCSSPLCRRDKRKRIHKREGGKREWYVINRLKCTNRKCGRLHNELPESLVPYKHYGSELIEDVVDEVRGLGDRDTEDYPSEATMKHWKWWVAQNEWNINGQIKSMLHHLLDLGVEFLKSRESLLMELRERISPGWLSAVVRLIYNSGGRIEPYPEAS